MVSSTKFPQTAVNNLDTGNNWSNVTAVTQSDNQYATVQVNDIPSDYLDLTNFGIQTPPGATIYGIQVEIERSYDLLTGSGAARDLTVQLLKNGIASGDNKATAIDWSYLSEETVIYGNSSDLWGTSWSDTDVSNTNFGVRIQAQGNSLGVAEARVDSVKITVLHDGTAETRDSDYGFETLGARPNVSQNSDQGVEVLGSPFNNTYNEATSGGIAAAGTSDVSVTLAPRFGRISDLGAEVAAPFPPDARASELGTETLGSPFNNIYNETTSGGTEVGGEADEEQTLAPRTGQNSDQGAEVLGFNGFYQEYGSGGAEISGEAEVEEFDELQIVRNSEQGVEVLGSSGSSVEQNEIGSEVLGNNGYFYPNGGAQTGGDADVIAPATYDETGSGGAESGGTADVQAIYNHVPTFSNELIHLKLDEGTGSLANDSSGNGHSGSISGFQNWESDPDNLQIENPYSFGLANTNNIDISDEADFVLDNFTISLWIKPSSTTSSTRRVVEYGITTWSSTGWLINQFDSRILWYFQTGFPLAQASGLSTGNWHHVAIRKSGNTHTVFVDGSGGTPVTSSASISTQHLIRIGTNSASQTYEGGFDDFRLFPNALSDFEITTLSNGYNIDRDAGVSGESTVTQNSTEQTSGGLEAGGESHVPSTYDVEASGGAEASGSTGNTTISTIVGTGGVEAGGSSTETLGGEINGEGGATTAGEADVGFYDIILPTGGLEAGGIAESDSPIVSSGGAELGGTSDNVVTYRTEIASGGVETGGESIPDTSKDIIGSGGAELAGSASTTFIDYIDGSGGLEAGGAADNDSPIFGLGGTTVGGESDSNVIYNEIASDGVEVEGTSPPEISNDFIASGGALAGETGSIEFSYNIDTAGGTTAEGSAEVEVIYNVNTSGGVINGGRATFVYNETTSGGVEVIGSSFGFRYDIEVSDGVRCGPLSEISNTSNCETKFKCREDEEDREFCTSLVPLPAFGSRLFTKHRGQLFTRPNCRRCGTAYVPQITACQKGKIRKELEDSESHRKTSI